MSDESGSILLTRVEDLLNWGRKNSTWYMLFGTACCAIELMATGASRFDISRFGAEVMRFSPRQSDLMVVSGTGFTPNTPLSVQGEGTTTLTGAADDSGAFTATLRTPSRASLGLTGMTPADLTITATDTASGDNASTVVSVALLGFHASAERTPVRLDQELEDARWFAASEIERMPGLLPQRFAIARRLLEAWFDESVGRPLPHEL